jgi:hypothetical protein
MYRRHNRLLFFALSAIIVAVIWGCSQPDDIIAPASSTDIILTPSRLPTPPPGMIYELWAVDADGEGLSLGKFDWDSRLYRFSDTSGNRIDSTWTVDFDVMKYKSICISVERFPDPAPDSMGPIMLKDVVVDPKARPMKLVFPIDLWLLQAGYFIQTPTDGNSNDNEASGLWFGFYSFDTIVVSDTLNAAFTIGSPVRLFTTDTTWDSSQVPPVIVDIDTIPNADPDSLSRITNYINITNERRDTNTAYIPPYPFYLDTFTQITIRYDSVIYPVNQTGDTIFYIDTLIQIAPNSTIDTFVDTFAMPPLTYYTYSITYVIDTLSKRRAVDRILPDSLVYDDIINLSGTGWHYKGWTISPYLLPRTSYPSISKPSWLDAQSSEYLTPISGGIISTGSFTDFNAPDDGNPYSALTKLPSVPGEDFLNNLPAGVTRIVLADSLNRSILAGTVFISLEPDNYDSISNFPLILLTSEGLMPSYTQISSRIPHTQHNRMTNWYRMVENDPIGFPSVRAILIRK